MNKIVNKTITHSVEEIRKALSSAVVDTFLEMAFIDAEESKDEVDVMHSSIHFIKLKTHLKRGRSFQRSSMVLQIRQI